MSWLAADFARHVAGGTASAGASSPLTIPFEVLDTAPGIIIESLDEEDR